MNNFARTLHLALRYRWTVAASVLCSLIVAVIWGGNIGALYPLVSVCFQGHSLRQWVDESIKKTQENEIQFRGEMAQFSADLAKATNETRLKLAAQLADAQARVQAEQWAEQKYRRLKPYIERYAPDDPFMTVVLLVVTVLACTLVKDVFIALGAVLVDRLAGLTAFDLRNRFYRRTMRMELASFGESGTSDLLSRFTYDVDNVAGGVQAFFGRSISEPLKMLVCLAGAAWVCWPLLVLSLVIAPLALYLIGRLAKTLKRANRRALEQMSSLYNVLVETLNGIKIVKAFTMERHERRRFHKINKQCYRKGMRIAFFDGLINPVTELMGICTICLAILLGAYLAMNQKTHLLGIRMSERPLDLPSLFVFYAWLVGVSDPARKLADVYNRLQRASAASDRVYQLLDREPGVREAINPKPFRRHHRDLVFDHVSFSYTPGHNVLEEIDLAIPFGETIAIVGPNGCGKSTFANLILRFFDPIEGHVHLDGTNLRDVRLRDLRSQIGLVTQETLLFDDTILNNIRYGSPWATRDQVVAAAKQAHAHSFIEQRLENGYETLVGAQGNRLSGGQRQRIALARAILRDPAILILDEATSQIDLESEQLIHKVLQQFIRNRTTVIITHRLETLALADRIIVMEGGRITDLGSHDQLLARSDLYRRLYQIQFKNTA